MYFGKTVQHIVIGLTQENNMSNICSWQKYVKKIEFTESVSNFTTCGSAFAACDNLKIVIFNDGNFINCSANNEMFSYCKELEYVSDFSIPISATVGNMFNYCLKFNQNIQITNTNNVADFSGMFNNCTNFNQPVTLDTSAGENFSYMFNNCNSFNQQITLDTSAGQSFGHMFENCYNLEFLPNITLDSAVSSDSLSYMFSATKITIIPAYDLTTLQSGSSLNLKNGYSETVPYPLTAFLAQVNDQNDITLQHHDLGRDGLLAFFNNLPSISTNKTIELQYTRGVSELSAPDLAIATDKGWTVLI